MAREDILLRKGLASIRLQIEELHIPTSAYTSIALTGDEFFISIMYGDDSTMMRRRIKTDDYHQEIIEAIRKYNADNNIKVVAANIVDDPHAEELGAKLWLEEDIVPFVNLETEIASEGIVQEAARHVRLYFDEHDLVIVPLDAPNEVSVTCLVTPEEYKQTVSPKAWKYLLEQARLFRERNNRIVFFNATPQGGGVALMRHGLLRLFRLLGIDAHWHVMQPNSNVFEITKTKFHNVLQGVAPEGVELTDHDKELFTVWSTDNAEVFQNVIRTAKVIVIDDPQPSGMIPRIREYNPHVRLVYRSHIHLNRDSISAPNTPAEKSWQFIWNNVQHADLFVAHPVETFIPYEAHDNAVTMPATTDPLDGLNKELSAEQSDYYLRLFNKILLEHDQKPLDTARPYIVQITRFDPSKGIPDVIESYRLLRERLPKNIPTPQLVLAGHGSIDDPDSVPVYNMTLHLLQEEQYRHLADDVKVVRLHHNDQILNSLLRNSKVVLQLSHREGFEVKVTEALRKGKPVIAFRAGGIPLQIDDGKSGFLVDVGDCQKVAEHLLDLLSDEKLYKNMSRQARESINPHFFMVHNAIKWLFLVNHLVNGGTFSGQGKPVQELIEAELD